MNVTVRRPKREDLPALVWCANSSSNEEERRGFGRPLEQRMFGSVERLSKAWEEGSIRRDEMLVAEIAAQVVGFVTMEARPDTLELDDLAVAGPFQRRGIGLVLVEAVEDRARELGKGAVTLGTSRNRFGTPWKSYDWWKRRGYRVTGETRNAWTESFGGSEIRMRKDLAGRL